VLAPPSLSGRKEQHESSKRNEGTDLGKKMRKKERNDIGKEVKVKEQKNEEEET
jgi:hypothetical protein